MKNLHLLIFISLFFFGCKEEKPKANRKKIAIKSISNSGDTSNVQKVDYTLYQQYVDMLKKSRFDSIWMSKDSNLFELKITGEYLETELKSKNEEQIFKDLELYVSLYQNSNLLFKKTYSFNQFHKDWNWLTPSQLPLEDLHSFVIKEFDEEDQLIQISFVTSAGPTCEAYYNSLLLNFKGEIINHHNSMESENIFFTKTNLLTNGFTNYNAKTKMQSKLSFFKEKAEVFIYPSTDKKRVILFYINKNEENYDNPFKNKSSRSKSNLFILDDSLNVVYQTKMFGTSHFLWVAPLSYQSEVSNKIYFLDDYNDKVLVLDKSNFNRLDSFSFYKKFGKKLTNELKYQIDLDKKGELILKKDKI